MNRFDSYIEEMKQSDSGNAIFFYPKLAIFIYRDALCPTDRVCKMIESGELLFAGIALHQGNRMPKYILK